MQVYGLDWAGPGQRQLTDAFECCNEPSGSVKCGEFLDQLQTSQLLKKDSAPWSKYNSVNTTIILEYQLCLQRHVSTRRSHHQDVFRTTYVYKVIVHVFGSQRGLQCCRIKCYLYKIQLKVANLNCRGTMYHNSSGLQGNSLHFGILNGLQCCI